MSQVLSGVWPESWPFRDGTNREIPDGEFGNFYEWCIGQGYFGRAA